MFGLFKREMTIGDILVDSLRTEPQAWERVRDGRETWYRHTDRRWQLHLFAEHGCTLIRFSEAPLTPKEERRLKREIQRWEDLSAEVQRRWALHEMLHG